MHVLADQHDEWLKASPADEEDSWANITDLEAGSHYTFAVIAANLINQTKSDTITVLVGKPNPGGRTDNDVQSRLVKSNMFQCSFYNWRLTNSFRCFSW